VTAWLIVLMSAVAGIVPGAVLLSLLAVLFTYLFAREALNDGQYAMVFALLTVPVGGLIGAAIGASWAYGWLGRPAIPIPIWLAGGLLVLALVWMFTWGWRIGKSMPPWLWLVRQAGRGYELLTGRRLQ
jgi:hypothetical protein